MPNTAPCGSRTTAIRGPSGMSVGGISSSPPAAPGSGGRRVDIRHGEVRQPVRRCLRREPVVHDQHPAEVLTGHAPLRVPVRCGVHRPAEDRGVEGERRVGLAGDELDPAERTGVVQPLRTGEGASLPQREHRTGRIGDHREPALVEHVHRADQQRAARRFHPFDGAVRVLGGEGDRPGGRLTRLIDRAERRHPGVAEVRHRVAARLLARIGLRAPAEQGRVERLGGRDVGGTELDPAGAAGHRFGELHSVPPWMRGRVDAYGCPHLPVLAQLNAMTSRGARPSGKECFTGVIPAKVFG